jgi:hypothetical protein
VKGQPYGVSDIFHILQPAGKAKKKANCSSGLAEKGRRTPYRGRCENERGVRERIRDLGAHIRDRVKVKMNKESERRCGTRTRDKKVKMNENPES